MTAYSYAKYAINCFFNKKIPIHRKEYLKIKESGDILLIPEIDKDIIGFENFTKYFKHSVDLQVYDTKRDKGNAILHCQLNDIAAFRLDENKDIFPF